MIQQVPGISENARYLTAKFWDGYFSGTALLDLVLVWAVRKRPPYHYEGVI